ncbi:MAG: bis-aminopropyl spermidine synthase family protein [Dehalococcoidia bacterium]
MDYSSNKILDGVLKSSNLSEGFNSLRLFLRYVFEIGPISTKDLSSLIGIPLPVVSSLRRELEKNKVLIRSNGMLLSDLGIDLVNQMGISGNMKISEITSSTNLSHLFENLIPDLEKMCLNRPSYNSKIDQSHVTVETTLKRVQYLIKNDAFEGRDILILGDDDLTSLAILLCMQKYQIFPKQISVVDIDDRILDFIGNHYMHSHIKPKLVHSDLSDGIDQDLLNKHDVFITDPPYTVDGFKLFISNAVKSLKNTSGNIGIISFPNPPVDNYLLIQKTLIQMGLLFREMIPGFNRYIGASIHGSTTNLIRCTTSNQINADVDINMSQIYTQSRE